jgi:hypothetical protein
MIGEESHGAVRDRHPAMPITHHTNFIRRIAIQLKLHHVHHILIVHQSVSKLR